MKSSCTIKSTVRVALKQDAKSKNQSQLGKDKLQSSERWNIQLDEGVLGEVKQRKLSVWREKVGEKEKTKWHNGKEENQTNRWEQHLKHRQAADMQNLQPTTPEGGSQSSSPWTRGITGPLWVRVHFKKTQEQNLKTNFELNPPLIILDVISVSHRITMFMVLWKKNLADRWSDPPPRLQMREEKMRCSLVSMVTIMSPCLHVWRFSKL